MASILLKNELPLSDENTDFVDYNSATLIESEVPFGKEFNSSETGWQDLNSDPPTLDSVDYSSFSLVKNPLSEFTTLNDSPNNPSTSEDDQLIRNIAWLAEIIREPDLGDLEQYNEYVNEYVYNINDAVQKRPETDESAFLQIKSALKNPDDDVYLASPALSSTASSSKCLRFEDSISSDMLTPCPSLLSDMDRFSGIEPFSEKLEDCIAPELLDFLNDVPERPWYNELELPEMNTWQRDTVLDAIDSTKSPSQDIFIDIPATPKRKTRKPRGVPKKALKKAVKEEPDLRRTKAAANSKEISGEMCSPKGCRLDNIHVSPMQPDSSPKKFPLKLTRTPLKLEGVTSPELMHTPTKLEEVASPKLMCTPTKPEECVTPKPVILDEAKQRRSPVSKKKRQPKPALSETVPASGIKFLDEFSRDSEKMFMSFRVNTSNPMSPTRSPRLPSMPALTSVIPSSPIKSPIKVRVTK